VNSVRAFVCGPGQIALVVLKLTGVTTWSWWWIMAPLWISALLWVLALCALVFALHLEARRQARLLMRRIALAAPELVRLLAGDEERDGATG
jgi:hypothetical protein